ncbi:sensor histidine kinase [Nakamurella lactea]|uniref:sensor histidine kinase n=1 Tax=Nakamurella lactea TaxID=459515 RepID=UPI00040E9CC5|nr:histidine kinase [Nakamurella lactea]
MTNQPCTPQPRVSRTELWVTVVGVGLLIGFTLFGQLSSGAGALPLWGQITVAAAAIGLLPVLLRRPVPGALGLTALAGVSGIATPGSTFATFYVARTRPLPVAIAVAGAGVAVHLLRWWWEPMPGLGFGWWVLLDVLAHGALLAWGACWRARWALIGSLRERAAAAEAGRERQLQQARAQERALIAREMHDVLAHRLSLLATYAGALEFRPDAPPERLAQAAGVVRAGTHQALDELREVIGLLRDGDPEAPARPQPGLQEIAELVREAAAAGTEVTLRADHDDPQALPGTTARTAYRLVQEGLTNARKHAPGAPVTVSVSGGPGAGLRVRVRNDAARVPALVGGGAGAGLVGLAERVELVGGLLRHGPDGSGFELAAELPWPE